jgi:transcriptional regulator with XRE-family HTH domain
MHSPTISDNIKTIRKHFSLSQAQFAQKIKRSPGFIANVELGKSDVSSETVKAVCSAFGINEDWLVYGTGEMFVDGHDVSEADMENVGRRIREIRKKEKLTQEQFGKAVGYSKMQVHFVESGKANPSNEFIENVASSFHVSYNWLMTGVGKIEAEEAVVDDKLIEWLKKNPDVVKELRIRGGLN